MKNKKIYIGIVVLLLLTNFSTLSAKGMTANDDSEILLINEYSGKEYIVTNYVNNDDEVSDIIFGVEELEDTNGELFLNLELNDEIVLGIDKINNEIPVKAIPMADVYVDDDNTEGPWDGTYKHPYQHIQEGIDAAEEGDVVYVFSGKYIENVVIEKSVTLKGEDRDNTVIDGDLVTDTVWIESTYVSFSGFKVINSIEDDFSAGINIWFSTNISISNCILINNDASIRLRNSDRCDIYNCIIRNNFGPVYVMSSSNININNCYTKDNEDWWNDNWAVMCGIVITSTSDISENILISNCNIDSDFGPGIYLGDRSANNVTIKNNIISNIKYAGGIVVCGLPNEQYSDISICNNEIKNCPTNWSWPAGIYISCCIGGITIKHNNILSNKKGAYIHLSSGIKFIENNFIDNEKSAGFSYLEDQSNTWARNYWDEQILHGNPKIILGILYLNYKLLPWLDFDWNPAKKPYNIIV